VGECKAMMLILETSAVGLCGAKGNVGVVWRVALKPRLGLRGSCHGRERT
jgi:hypothetical protein